MNKVIIVDRDGTLLKEPYDEQIDALEKVEFVPGAISGLKALTGLGYELVMASNQDGLGTSAFPEETFWPAQNLLLKTLEGSSLIRPSRRINLPTESPVPVCSASTWTVLTTWRLPG